MNTNSVKPRKLRCFFCNKKHLITVQCKCNHTFCLTHKYPEVHNCECPTNDVCTPALQAIIPQKIEKI